MDVDCVVAKCNPKDSKQPIELKADALAHAFCSIVYDELRDALYALIAQNDELAVIIRVNRGLTWSWSKRRLVAFTFRENMDYASMTLNRHFDRLEFEWYDFQTNASEMDDFGNSLGQKVKVYLL